LALIKREIAVTDSSSLRKRFSDWWNDREFTKRQGLVHATVFSAISVSTEFGLAVFFGG
jgi:hypothetical protein